MGEMILQEKLFRHLVSNGIIDNNAKMNKLNKGGSGAILYEINSVNGNYILKNIHIDQDSFLLKSSEKEYGFYSISNEFDLNYLPKVIYTEKNDCLGIIIVLNKYTDIQRHEWNLKRQLSTVDIIAKIHSESDFFINRFALKKELFEAKDGQLEKSLNDWICVIKKYDLDECIINEIKINFGQVINFINSKKHYFCHGDFHPDNFVLDEKGELVILDWANYHIGCKDEIAFFISRGYDCGIDIQEESIKKHYCERLSYYSGENISMLDIEVECNMSTVFVSFLYWAEYLQDTNIDRVNSIYEKMIYSYKWLVDNFYTW